VTGTDAGLIGELRARHPEAVAQAAARRRRRPFLDDSGRLMLIAADHPARAALAVRGRALAMADRRDLLRRLVAALARPGVDGVLGTADILEDLLLLGALDGKVVVGSMNRGGLAGSAFELDDRFTGCDAATIAALGFDAGKMLCRIGLDDPATAATLEACGQAVTQLAGRRLVAMIEPFLADRDGGTVRHRLTAEAVITALSVAAGLGATSAYTWLKVPVVPGMERVMAATTLPALLLGGDPRGAPQETYRQWEQALALPGVRGLVVGRALLYPPDDDVEAAVDTAAGLVRPAPAPRETT
jgi:DhnA family fructose-bisphosphate aldolase class Ia